MFTRINEIEVAIRGYCNDFIASIGLDDAFKHTVTKAVVLFQDVERDLSDAEQLNREKVQRILVEKAKAKLEDTPEKLVVRLSVDDVHASPTTQDGDPLMSSRIMGDSDYFLKVAQRHHLEFSSLRRAKFSTLVLLRELHKEKSERQRAAMQRMTFNMEATLFHLLATHVKPVSHSDLTPQRRILESVATRRVS